MANPTYRAHHKHHLPQIPKASPNLADKAQGEGSGESSNRAMHQDGIPSHVSQGSNEYNRNVFRSRGHLGFDVPSSGVARWFAPVSAAELKSAVILGRLGNGG